MGTKKHPNDQIRVRFDQDTVFLVQWDSDRLWPKEKEMLADSLDRAADRLREEAADDRDDTEPPAP